MIQAYDYFATWFDFAVTVNNENAVDFPAKYAISAARQWR